MKILLLVGAIIVIPVIIFLVYRYIKFQIESEQMNALRWKRIQPLHEKLEKDIYVPHAEIDKLATDVLTRVSTYQTLARFGKTELFPVEFLSIKKAAESILANWLEFPTELGACPDDVEFVAEVPLLFDDNPEHKMLYQVFRFKTKEPHWAADVGWSLGVVGPYFEDSEPYNAATAFSRIGPESQTSPQKEAEWMHKNIALRR